MTVEKRLGVNKLVRALLATFIDTPGKDKWELLKKSIFNFSNKNWHSKLNNKFIGTPAILLKQI